MSPGGWRVPWLKPSSGRHAARQHLGARSEQLAQRLLISEGYQIERTNVRFPVGEIDIIAREGETLCFVEVRSASSDEWGGPLASVGWRKQRRLIRAAQWYLQRLPTLPRYTRFDVIAITWDDSTGPSVELVRGAFDAS